MGKLSILGAQRVKALTEFLNVQMKAALEEAEAKLPTEEQIREDVDMFLGTDGLKDALDFTLREANILADQIQEISGESFSIPKDAQDALRNSYSPRHSKAEKLYWEHKRESDKVLDEIKQEFKEKEQRLWLCETLEEAKEIVGLE